MPAVIEVPLTMLVISLEVDLQDRRELFGFWYYGNAELPRAATSWSHLLWDCAEKKCCQLRLRGSQDQICGLLESAAGHLDDSEKLGALIHRARTLTAQRPGVAFDFDNLNRPKGTFIPVVELVRVLGVEEELLAELRKRPESIEMELDPDWWPGEGLIRALSDPDNR